MRQTAFPVDASPALPGSGDPGHGRISVVNALPIAIGDANLLGADGIAETEVAAWRPMAPVRA